MPPKLLSGFFRLTYAGSDVGLMEVRWNEEETAFVIADHVHSVANKSFQCLGWLISAQPGKIVNRSSMLFLPRRAGVEKFVVNISLAVRRMPLPLTRVQLFFGDTGPSLVFVMYSSH